MILQHSGSDLAFVNQRKDSGPGSACKDLERHHFMLTTNKNLSTKKSTTLLGSIKEVRSQGEPLSPNWRDTGEDREPWLLRQRLRSRNCTGTSARLGKAEL